MLQPTAASWAFGSAARACLWPRWKSFALGVNKSTYSQPSHSSMNVAQNRLTQVFKFLKELNGLRNPVPRDVSSYAEVLRLDAWPAHPFLEVRRGDPREEDDEAVSDAELEPLIRIRRTNLTACPKPPELLDGWLKPGWQSVEAQPEVLASRNFLDKKKGT